MKTYYFVLQSTFMTDENQKPLEDLGEIRRIMERSSKFISLSGLSGISAGILALVGAALAYKVLDYGDRFYDREFTLHDGLTNTSWMLVAIGLGVLILSLLAAYFFTRQKAKKLGLPMWDHAAKKLMINLFIPLIAGGIFCVIILFEYGYIKLIAPATLIFYGLALVNASKFSTDELRFLGISDIILGLVALLYPGYGLLFWALGFGLLHIIYGVVMYKKSA